MGPASARKVINLEEVDDEVIDERTARRWRRRCIANGNPDCGRSTIKKSRKCNAEVENLMLDKDYEKYLCLIEDGGDRNEHSSDHHIDIRPSVDDRNVDSLNDGLDDDDMDPHYKLFWNNLREDGNSYALEMVQEDGSLKQIRYHQADGLPDELNLEIMPQLKEKTEIKNRATLETLVDAPKKKSLVVKRNLKLDTPEPVSDGTDVRSSKIPHIEVPSTPESSRSSPLKEKTQTRRTSRMVMKKDHPKKNSSKVKKHVKVEDADPRSGRTNGRSNKQPGSKNLWFSEGGSNSEAESDSNVTDDSYQEFLSRTKDDGKIVVFKPKNCEPIIYDADIESSSDSDVIVLDRDPHEGYRTPIKIDVDSRWGTDSHSQFRQGIMKDLKRPYDLEEYLNLLEDWSRQRPPTSHDRNLRNGKIKSYSLPGEFGRSYQEMYKDLAGKIDAATGNDRPKKLNLLRGFFYWLKNVTQEGSFKPWNDKACLRVLPEKR
ncbi:hypothetical protein M0R45_011399 [Rubus argutus]|uniref:Uncharacterized protein n=1 Tax=Rubus argutus TaxID=59490 RepID=A0AAW1Y9Y4_RUBAR